MFDGWSVDKSDCRRFSSIACLLFARLKRAEHNKFSPSHFSALPRRRLMKSFYSIFIVFIIC
jgi:hypothetical protein